jgi:hypothetical protein
MLMIAAIAVALALFILVPPLAIVLLISAAPALAITEFIAYRRQRRGEPTSVLQRVVWCVGLTILIPIFVIAALIAVVVICVSASR